ncbi:hypothetical protein DFQ28_004479 [Apophysomyces sp. BC1034]|nr:hypothetical protein DFQ30_002707 [Apophysomyces sp. BC1015]KAG0182868.1 hypothetical protein DFQ29_001567 [Apophysomyces sp. BC1021]KAG0193587.1 hypothetical protein DFQ28_004479 [Apophysomyces sp. BC1034]
MAQPAIVTSLNGSPITEAEEDDFDVDMLDEWGWTAADLVSENDFDMIDMLSAALDQVTFQLHERQREFRAKSSEWTTKTKDRIRTQTKKLEDRRALIHDRLQNHYRQINDRMNRDEKTIHMRDKLSFVVGVGNACITPVLASRIPEWIPLYYSLQSIYLLPLRFVIYRYRRWHYFIFDLCYFVNAMTLLFLWFFPTSPTLFIATYCLTNGPVAWAIVTWRNSLVFHSLDKVTSVFIHIFPPLVTYTIRWMPELQQSLDATQRNTRFPALAEIPTMNFKDTMFFSTVAYLIWQVLYFIFIIVKRREKVESGLRLTSYSWLLNDSQGRKGFIQHASFVFGPKYKIYMFMLLQLVYNMATTIPTYFLYKSFWLHTTFLIAMFAASVWNGASYYIDVFSRRYNLEIEQIIKKKEPTTNGEEVANGKAKST